MLNMQCGGCSIYESFDLCVCDCAPNCRKNYYIIYAVHRTHLQHICFCDRKSVTICSICQYVLQCASYFYNCTSANKIVFIWCSAVLFFCLCLPPNQHCVHFFLFYCSLFSYYLYTKTT